MAWVLENELQSQSQLPILTCIKAGILKGAGPNTRRRIFREGIRDTKVSSIQDVLDLNAKLQLGSLGKPRGLKERSAHFIGNPNFRFSCPKTRIRC